MIDAVLVYPIRDGKVLMIQGAQPYAPHYRKWNGPGGKLKDGQTFLECALAELFEETGLTALETEDVGLLTVFVDGCLTRRVRMYRVTQFSGIPTSNGREGALQWFSIYDIPAIPTLPADQHFLPWVLHGYFVHVDVYINDGLYSGHAIRPWDPKKL